MKQFKIFFENENIIDDRKIGKMFSEKGFVTIYRADLPQNNLAGKKEYVTMSLKFAKEHSDHQAAVHEEIFVVKKYTVESKHVFEAYNPGEYFYFGPPEIGRIIYTSNDF